MKPADREQWILHWMTIRRHDSVDILYEDFVDDYVKATACRSVPQMFGADKCPQMSSDLRRMYAKGLLKRSPRGLPAGFASMGFPKWVYVYTVVPTPVVIEQPPQERLEDRPQ